jgi:hypothetical protein
MLPLVESGATICLVTPDSEAFFCSNVTDAVRFTHHILRLHRFPQSSARQMSKKPSLVADIVTLISRLPWWVGLLLAAASYYGFHILASVNVPTATKAADAGPLVIWQFARMAGTFLQYLVPLRIRPTPHILDLMARQDVTGFQFIGSSESRSLLLDPGSRVSTSVR